MKKLTIVISVVAVILVVGIIYFMMGSTNSGTDQIVSSGGNQLTSTDNNVNSNQESNTQTNTPSENTKVITISASKFQFNPGTITVNKGDHVKIVVDSTDTTHGIAIPDYGVSGVESVEFTADKAGSFTFRCPTPCGPGHKTMTGTLVVV